MLGVANQYAAVLPATSTQLPPWEPVAGRPPARNPDDHVASLRICRIRSRDPLGDNEEARIRFSTVISAPTGRGPRRSPARVALRIADRGSAANSKIVIGPSDPVVVSGERQHLDHRTGVPAASITRSTCPAIRTARLPTACRSTPSSMTYHSIGDARRPGSPGGPSGPSPACPPPRRCRSAARS